jgi:hypothetical protein
VLIGGATQAAATGLVLLLLLPPLSDVRVGFGTTFIAALIGNLISVVGTLVLLRSAVQSNLDAGGGAGLLPAFGLLSLGLTVLGIFVTATIIGGSSARWGRRRRRTHEPVRRRGLPERASQQGRATLAGLEIVVHASRVWLGWAGRRKGRRMVSIAQSGSAGPEAG